jgi:solute:Na+ symporter, SSS family
VFGAIIVGISLLVNSNRQTDVFTLLNQLMVSLGLPLTIPLFLGLFYSRTPDWSAWVTALTAFCFSAWANFGFAPMIADPQFLPSLPAFVQQLIGREAQVLTGGERSDLLLIVTVLGTSVTGVLTFFASSLFYKTSSPAHRKRTEGFFAQLRLPVKPALDADISDEPVYRLLGTLCMVYGVFILLLMLIPNPLLGRMCFLFVGGVITVVGTSLYVVANRKRRRATAGLAQPPVPLAAPHFDVS